MPRRAFVSHYTHINVIHITIHEYSAIVFLAACRSQFSARWLHGTLCTAIDAVQMMHLVWKSVANHGVNLCDRRTMNKSRQMAIHINKCCASFIMLCLLTQPAPIFSLLSKPPPTHTHHQQPHAHTSNSRWNFTGCDSVQMMQMPAVAEKLGWQKKCDSCLFSVRKSLTSGVNERCWIATISVPFILSAF